MLLAVDIEERDMPGKHQRARRGRHAEVRVDIELQSNARLSGLPVQSWLGVLLLDFQSCSNRNSVCINDV